MHYSIIIILYIISGAESTHQLLFLSKPIVVNSDGLSENKYCTCGSMETQYHYFLECKYYIIHRDIFVMWCQHSFNLEKYFVWFEDNETVK